MTDLFAVAQDRLLWQWKKFDIETVPVYFSVSVTGTGWSEAGIETIIIGYVDALDAGGDIVAADLTELLVADSTIDTVDSLEFSRYPQAVWESNPPESIELDIFSTEQATTDAAKIDLPTPVDIYVYIEWSPGGSEQDVRDAVAAYINGLGAGMDVTIAGVTAAANAVVPVTQTYMDTTGPPSTSQPTVDISISSNQISRTFANPTYIGVSGGS